MSQGDSAQQQALADQHHQHLDADGLQLHGASDSQQQQHGSQDVAPPQLDMLSQQLHQVLVADTTRFWSATVGPSAQSIFQVSTTAVVLFQGQSACPCQPQATDRQQPTLLPAAAVLAAGHDAHACCLAQHVSTAKLPVCRPPSACASISLCWPHACIPHVSCRAPWSCRRRQPT